MLLPLVVQKKLVKQCGVISTSYYYSFKKPTVFADRDGLQKYHIDREKKRKKPISLK
jgi:hypothetical protein